MFGVWGLGFGVWGIKILRLDPPAFGVAIRVSSCGFRGPDFESRASSSVRACGSGLVVEASGFRVSGFWFLVSGLDFRFAGEFLLAVMDKVEPRDDDWA